MRTNTKTSATADLTVQDDDLATAFGSGDVPVLGTPRLIALCEVAAVAAVAPFLEEDETTVGIHVDIRHQAPSPPGSVVKATATLDEVDNGRLTFSVKATQGRRQVAEGRIVRMVVDRPRFMARITGR